MLKPKPTQISGARFLAERRRAMLADLPRVGKTGAAIIAADMIMAQSILVVTTASGRGVWKAGFEDWSDFGRKIATPAKNYHPDANADVSIISWGVAASPMFRTLLMMRNWDLLILDEAHAAKNFETKRTQAVYGNLRDDGASLDGRGLVDISHTVWPLTGTPLPNSPLDAYPMLRALAPKRLAADAARGWPDVTKLSAYRKRYCKMRPVKVGHGFGAKWIDVFVEGVNLDELRARMDGFYLQRTQADVGILEPEYEILPLTPGMNASALLRSQGKSVSHTAVLEAAEAGRTRDLEMHLGPLRRITGDIKAGLLVDMVKEELEIDVEKIVLAYWHKDVGDTLEAGLKRFGVVRLDGSTLPAKRAEIVAAFRDKPSCRVFLGQIQAAGEAIDLSAAAHLIFVESSLVPKDMLQMSLRVANHTQKERPLVRVASLDGSIDLALQKVLMRKWTAINQVLS